MVMNSTEFELDDLDSFLDALVTVEHDCKALEDQFAQLGEKEHIPRDASDKRLESLLTQCASNCPTCVLEAQIAKRLFELGDLQQQLLVKVAKFDAFTMAGDCNDYQ